jgi:hypothetical protein
MTGHELVVRRPVVTRVRQQVQPRRLREPAEQKRIAPEVGRSALDERAEAPLPGLLKEGKGNAEDVVRAVAIGAHAVGADEVHEDVLVH